MGGKMTDLNDFNDRVFLEVTASDHTIILFRKICKSAFGSISDRQLQFVFATLLAGGMEPRSSCKFVLQK